MLRLIKRAVSEVRQQPLVGSLTIFGTAFAVFLAMVVMMTAQVKVTPFAPESCRDRLFIGKNYHESSLDDKSNSSSGLSLASARRFYSGLEGVDTVSFMVNLWDSKVPVQSDGITYMKNIKLADAAFWTVFDHKFLTGRPYSEGAFESGIPEVVVSRSAAAELFGTGPEEAVGRTVIMGDREATVVGAVEDVTPLASYAYGEVYAPGTAFPALVGEGWNERFGNWQAAIVTKPGTTQEQLRAQVEERYRRLETELKALDLKPYYHRQPYTLTEEGTGGSNTDPQSDGSTERYVIYLMLVLIPAINLSSITHSRLRHRTAETGVRRAFGASRTRIFADLVAENFFVTLAGALIGMLVSFIVTWACADYLFHLSDWGPDAVFSPMMLVDWTTVGFMLLIAFVLNLLSAGIPALQAARVNPVSAISGRNY